MHTRKMKMTFRFNHNQQTKGHMPETPQITISDKEADNIAQSIYWLCFKSYGINVKNGWWEKRNRTIAALDALGIDHRPNQMIEVLGLVGTEVSEAIEAARKHSADTWSDPYTKDTLVRECAGTVVRLMDLCQHFGLPLGEAIVEELRVNIQRGYMHGGKKA